jgi:hypothetical protein
MPYRQLPKSNRARHSAMRIAKERKDTVPAATVPLMPPTQTWLDTFQPLYAGLRNAVNHARALQMAQTEVVNPLKRMARLWVGHGYQAVVNATVREQFPVAVLGHYKLPATAKGAPAMASDQSILDAYDDYVEGENVRTGAGGAAVSFPALTDIIIHVDAFRAANLVQADLKDAYDAAQEALMQGNVEADRLILKLWNEIEAAFDTGDKPSMRRKAREWGVVYVPSPGETPLPEEYSVMGRVLDSETREPREGVEVSLDGTDIITTTDSEGRYYLPFTAAGSYTLRASLPGYVDHTQPVTVADDTLPEVNIALVAEIVAPPEPPVEE